MRSRALTILLTLLCFLAVPSLSASSERTRDEQIDRFVAAQMEKHKMPGMSVAVMRNGKLALAKGYGTSSIEFNLPATKDTVYRIASVSKVVTSVALLRLVEQGKLSLEAPITQYLPDLPKSFSTVPVWKLMNHTAGLAEPPNPTTLADEGAKLTVEQYLKLVTDSDPKPEAKWRYGAANYVLLLLAVEKVTGKTFDEYVQSELLKPQGIEAVYGDSRTVVRNRTPSNYLYTKEGTLEYQQYFYPHMFYGGAGLNLSVTAMAKFFAALDSGKLLKKATLEEAWAERRLAAAPLTMTFDDVPPRYGLGLVVGSHNGHRSVSHEGGGCAWSLYFPDDHLAVVVFTNLSRAGDAEAIPYGIADFFLKR